MKLIPVAILLLASTLISTDGLAAEPLVCKSLLKRSRPQAVSLDPNNRAEKGAC